MDVLGELQAEFEQVSPPKWLPLVGEHTFRSQRLMLSHEEALALHAANEHARQQRGAHAPTEQQLACLEEAKARLQALLEESFVNEESGEVAAFVKMLDRSPKDAENLKVRIRKLYEQRLEDTAEAPCSNRHLQAYCWAKARALLCHSAEEAFELLLHSERAASELEMKALVSGAPVGLLVREWVDFDPAFEFRAFVVRDAFHAYSQMDTMDVALHYPQVRAMQVCISPFNVLMFFSPHSSVGCSNRLSWMRACNASSQRSCVSDCFPSPPLVPATATCWISTTASHATAATWWSSTR